MSENFGRVLRVDLTTGQVEREFIPPEETARFLGGRGLGAYLLYRELAPGVNPLGEENKLIFSTGPLTGTGAPGSSKYVVSTKSPLTGIYLMAISSRAFGVELRKAGYDVLIVQGRAKSPVYLWVSDGKVELRDAAGLWGRLTDETEAALRGELGDQVRVACIGPAGENLVRYAAIINDTRAAGRGGAGAVMGSKNLKAIAVRGTVRVEVADPGRFRAAVKKAAEEVAQNPKTEAQKRYGTAASVDSLNKLGIMPLRNWQKTHLVDIEPLSAETLRQKYMVKSTTCAPCPVFCTKLCRVNEGPYAGVSSEGPEYETIYSLGTSCDIRDFGAIINADLLCDRYGLDTMSAGVSISFAMECFEKGYLTPKDTGGVALEFGRAEIIPDLLAGIAFRRGFGDFLAEGTRRMSGRLGPETAAFAMHVKGMEMGAYDPRGVKGMALVYACGARGGCHHAGGRTIPEEVDKFDRFAPGGKGDLVKKSREKRVIYDSAIKCSFNAFSDAALAELLSAATGIELTPSDLDKTGDRISCLERLFNNREGVARADDTLPGRLLAEPLPDGPAAGQVVELDVLLDEFYRACGWDASTGVPRPEKLLEVGLGDLVPEAARLIDRLRAGSGGRRETA